MAIASGCLALGANSAFAENPPPLVSEAEYFSDIPVVQTVTRLPQTRSETPAAVTVIDRDMIKASGVRQIADLFRLVPGFQVGYENGYSPKVTYHGFADQFPRRMQILIDGRSVYSPFFGGVFWADLPLALEDIERIEVVRGPNAAVYGSNAFLGVINIITRHPSQDPGTFVKAASGDNHIRDGLLRHGWTGADRDVRVSIGYHADDGFDEKPDNQRTPFVSLRADFRASPADTFEFQLGASHASREDGFLNDADTVPRYTDTHYHFEQLRWRRSLGAGEELSVQFYHNYYRLNDDYLTEPLNLGPLGIVRVPISYDAAEERYDIEFQHILNPAPDWRLVWGAGVRDDRAWSQTWFSTDSIVQNGIYRFFGNAEWRVTPETVVNAGAMVEKADTTGADTSPRLALNYHVTPHHTLRAAMSKAYRTPDLPERWGNNRFSYGGTVIMQDIVGLERIKPEVMTSTELGYFGQAPERQLNWDIRVYKDQIREIVLPISIPSRALTGKATGFRNEGAFVFTGIDAQLEYRPQPDTRLFIGHSQMLGKSTDVDANSSTAQRQREKSVPRYNSSLLAMRRLSGPWYGSVGYYRTAEMLWLGNGDFTDAYTRTDLRLSRKFRLGEERGEAALVIQNAEHNNYFDFRMESASTRRVFFTLSLDIL